MSGAGWRVERSGAWGAAGDWVAHPLRLLRSCCLAGLPAHPPLLLCRHPTRAALPAGEGARVPRVIFVQAGAAAARHSGGPARALWRDACGRAHPGRRVCGARQQARHGERAAAQRAHAAVWRRAVPPCHGRVQGRCGVAMAVGCCAWRWAGGGHAGMLRAGACAWPPAAPPSGTHAHHPHSRHLPTPAPPRPAGIGTINCPDISREEIVNACGIDDFHDGVNYTRTACVIAVSTRWDAATAGWRAAACCWL